MEVHFNVRKELFYLTISPEKQMYINYLAVYDGIWSGEQLGLGSLEAKSFDGPHYASTVKTIKTVANNYTFTNLNKRSRYVYRVRSLGADNNHSQWSDEHTFTFAGTTGVEVFANDSSHEDDGMIRVYDSQGRLLHVCGFESFSLDNVAAHGLLIVKQGNNVRKVLR